MTDQRYTVGPIEVRWGRDRYRYYTIDDVLYSEWKRGVDSSKSSWSLRGVSPRLGETSGRSDGVVKTIRLASLLMICSLIMYFSDYNKAIPLLAPFLGLWGAWWFINTLSKVLPRNWTLFRKVSGEDAFWLVQPSEKSQEWLRFEAEVVREIERVNETEA